GRGAPLCSSPCQMCLVQVSMPSAQTPEVSSGSAMCGQSGGKATKASPTRVTSTFTPWISMPVSPPVATSCAEQSLCQPNCQLHAVLGAATRATSDRVVGSLVESACIEEDVALDKVRTVLVDPEPVVIFPDQEQLGLAGVDVRVDAVEHGPIAGKRGRGLRLATRGIAVYGIDRDVPGEPAMIGIVLGQHLDHALEPGHILLVPGHRPADFGTVRRDAIAEVRCAQREPFHELLVIEQQAGAIDGLADRVVQGFQLGLRHDVHDRPPALLPLSYSAAVCVSGNGSLGERPIRRSHSL